MGSPSDVRAAFPETAPRLRRPGWRATRATRVEPRQLGPLRRLSVLKKADERPGIEGEFGLEVAGVSFGVAVSAEVAFDRKLGALRGVIDRPGHFG
jgi:hypothetical protein